MNNVSLIGRTTDDIELRTTTNGKSVVNFTIAIPRKFKKDETDFVECQAWEKTAELLATYVHKGQQVGLFGSLQQEKWEKDGQKRSKLVVSVQDITFIVNESKPSQDEPQGMQTPSYVAASTDSFSVLPDELPFSSDDTGLPF